MSLRLGRLGVGIAARAGEGLHAILLAGSRVAGFCVGMDVLVNRRLLIAAVCADTVHHVMAVSQTVVIIDLIHNVKGLSHITIKTMSSLHIAGN